MEKELKEILEKLMKWSIKYNKDYVDLSVVDFSGMANIDTEDSDYKKTRLYIRKEEL